jgi:hypothetical protein
MRNVWKMLAVMAAVALSMGGPAWAGVPRVVFIEDFTATW